MKNIEYEDTVERVNSFTDDRESLTGRQLRMQAKFSINKNG